MWCQHHQGGGGGGDDGYVEGQLSQAAQRRRRRKMQALSEGHRNQGQLEKAARGDGACSGEEAQPVEEKKKKANKKRKQKKLANLKEKTRARKMGKPELVLKSAKRVRAEERDDTYSMSPHSSQIIESIQSSRK